MNQSKNDTPGDVICKICSVFYKGIHGDIQQGHNCASIGLEHDKKHYILGCYGSGYDADLFEWRDAPPDQFVKADPICDRCVGMLVDQGKITKLEGEYPWGPPWL